MLVSWGQLGGLMSEKFLRKPQKRGVLERLSLNLISFSSYGFS
jgi:hypothetical protein